MMIKCEDQPPHFRILQQILNAWNELKPEFIRRAAGHLKRRAQFVIISHGGQFPGGSSEVQSSSPAFTIHPLGPYLNP